VPTDPSSGVTYLSGHGTGKVDPAEAKRERWIGRYRLLSLLGEGGMGTVYLAEQREPVRRIVALKLMRSALAGSAATARFSAERQALARLSHPNVAAMYDAAATDAGFPFFVMERVEGEPLIRYCDRERLTIRDRVGLLIDVCNGVQHAHQKGIIHRDLKPSNVLVASVEGHATPKIIDFGIAKAIDQPLTDGTAIVTGIGIIGTPAYMSPEALSGDDVDTRTDVYSLGVILYELIAGVRPHRVDDLPLAAVIKSVSEQDAPLPRALYRTQSDTARRKIAGARALDERALVSLLASDLGWIARKATAREREERYGSAADLAADLARFLNDEPVTATPPTLPYRARKFMRRHRGAVAAAALLLLAIIGGIAGTTVGMLRAQRARAEAQAVSKFLTDLLESASPWQRRNETTVRELLGEAAQKIGHELRDQPAARAELLSTIGSSEFHLGHLESAERLFREALRLDVALHGHDSQPVAATLNDLGLVLKHQNRLPPAEAMLRESVRMRERVLGRDHPSYARGLFDLATVLDMRGKTAEAETAYREALARRETLLAAGVPGVDVDTVAITLNGLGVHLSKNGKPAEAETLIRRSLAMRRRAGSIGYAYALSTLDFGKVVAQQQRWAEAEALDRQGLASLSTFVERDDGRIVAATAQLQDVLRAEGK
jgi:serine/threonine protein kinase